MTIRSKSSLAGMDTNKNSYVGTIRGDSSWDLVANSEYTIVPVRGFSSPLLRLMGYKLSQSDN